MIDNWWIKCSDEMPIYSGEYFVVYHYSGKRSTGVFWFSNGEFTEDYGLISNDDVTHWQKLPAPPKGE